MIALKFLGRGAVGLFSGFAWPVPSADAPGPWVEVDGPLVTGSNGVHGCRLDDATGWMDDQLWLVELDGELREGPDTIVARRGRLLRRLEAWDEPAAREFAEACLRRTQYRLGLAGDELGDVQAAALEAADAASGQARDALHYLADAIELAAGGRPDRYAAQPGTDPPTPGALAANLGFVCAHAAGHLAAGPSAEDDAYAAGFSAERRHQLEWLTERLELERVLAPAPVTA